MPTQEPPPGFHCDALLSNKTCLCDDAPCHFPEKVLACFFEKLAAKDATKPHWTGDQSPPTAPGPNLPPSINASQAMLKGMMRRNPPKT